MEVLGKLLLTVAALVPVMTQDAPPVIECKDTWFGFYGQSHEIVCIAKASPVINDAYVTYYTNGRENDTVKLVHGERVNTKSFIFKAVEPNNSLELQFDQVFKQDFRNYTFFAGNSAGYTNLTVSLEKDPDSILPSSASWLRPSATLGLIVALSALWWQ